MIIIDGFKAYRKFLTVKRVLLIGCFAVVIVGFNQNTFAQIGGGAIIAVDESPTATASDPAKTNKVNKNPFPKTALPTAPKSSKTGASKTNTTAKTVSNKSKTVYSPKSTKTDNGFVIGDKYTFLNDEIAVPARPVYRKSAKDAGAVGLVQVEVLIDENGNVLTAKARTGNALLHPEAEKAALATKFNHPSIYGKPARAFGFIVYRFGTEEDEYNQEMKEKNNSPEEVENTPTPKNISGGILNGKAISLPKPVYPPAAKAAKADGFVNVKVTVDENGNVISAQAVSGNALLFSSAEQAAQLAKFSPTLLRGNRVKVTGIIVYNFTAQ